MTSTPASQDKLQHKLEQELFAGAIASCPVLSCPYQTKTRPLGIAPTPTIEFLGNVNTYFLDAPLQRVASARTHEAVAA